MDHCSLRKPREATEYARSRALDACPPSAVILTPPSEHGSLHNFESRSCESEIFGATDKQLCSN